MGYVPGFPIDVFLSYAHRDNADGWVESLHDYLSRRLPQFLEHDSEVRIWRDPKLGGFDLIWDTLQTNIKTSVLFLSICSPVYVTSESCEKEVHWFLDQSPSAPRVQQSSRIARAVIIPFKDARNIKSVFLSEDTPSYRFYKDRPDGTVAQHLVSSREFLDEAERLVQHIASRLRRLRDEVERKQARRSLPERKTLFVANCPRDRADERTTVINEFKDHELLMIPDGIYSADDLTRQTSDLLAKADVSIHILGEKPGVSVEDAEEPVAHLEYRLALAHRPKGFTQIVWASDTLKLEGRQQQFVQAIKTFKPDLWNEGTEVLSGGVDDLLSGIKGVLGRAPEIRHIEISGPLYLLCSKGDLDAEDANLTKLCAYLCQSGILPEFPAFEDQDDEDIDLAAVERNLIAQSCATLIYYGKGGDAWVKLKRQTLLRVLGELKSTGRYVRALYLSEPVSRSKKLQYLDLGIREFQEAQGFSPLLVLGEAGAFEPNHLKRLLDKLGGGETNS